jgi:hypothetical protein
MAASFTTGASLLEGRVENTPQKGFFFLVYRIEDLREVLAGPRVPTPKAASGAFLRVGRRGKRAG